MIDKNYEPLFMYHTQCDIMYVSLSAKPVNYLYTSYNLDPTFIKVDICTTMNYRCKPMSDFRTKKWHKCILYYCIIKQELPVATSTVTMLWPLLWDEKSIPLTIMYACPSMPILPLSWHPSLLKCILNGSKQKRRWLVIKSL